MACLLKVGLLGEGSVLPDVTITFGPASSSVLASFGEAFGNIPPAFAILQRINLGMTAVMAHLGATGNWRRAAEEMWVFTSGPPSSEMGEKEAAWLAGRAG